MVKVQKQEQPQYKDYLDLIRSEAWKRIRRNPLVEFDELVSAGSLAFTKALQTWDPAKGKFSTHLWWQIQDCMGNVHGCRGFNASYHDCTREKIEANTISLDDRNKNRRGLHLVHSQQQPGYDGNIQTYPISLDDEPDILQIQDDSPGPYEEAKFRSMVAGLGQEAQEVVLLVLGIPWELVDWTLRCVRPSRCGIRAFLRSMGWGHPKIDRAFKEIETGLMEL